MKRYLLIPALVLLLVACNGRLQPEEARDAARRASELYPNEYETRAPTFEEAALLRVVAAEVDAIELGDEPQLHPAFLDAEHPRFVTVDGPHGLEPLLALCEVIELRHGLRRADYPCDDLVHRVDEYEGALKAVAKQREGVALSAAERDAIANYLVSHEPEQLGVGHDRQVPDATLVALMFGGAGYQPLVTGVDKAHEELARGYAMLARHLARIEIQAHRLILQWAWDTRGKYAHVGWDSVETQRIWLDDLATRLQTSRDDKERIRLDLGERWPTNARDARDKALARVMTQVGARPLEEVLAMAEPPGGQYARLAKARERYARLVAGGGFVPLPNGATSLKPGVRSPLVPTLRQRLVQEGYAPGPGADTFDDTLAEALRAFQNAHQLVTHGRVDAATLAELGVSAKDRLASLDRNLARWRRSPPRAGRYIQVNLPDFHGELWDGGKRVHRFRIIVGSPRAKKRTKDGTELINATPRISAAIDRVIYNPYWNIPSRILTQEIVPKDLKDAPDADKIAYLESKGYQVRSKVEGAVERVRQPPGPGNALGQVKIIFPNKHDVYLHDTAQKKLFNKPRRAFSHGCMRVHEPLRLAQMLLELDGQFDEEKVGRVLRRRENTILFLNQKVLIHIEYYTVRVDKGGVAHFLPDVYGLEDDG